MVKTELNREDALILLQMGKDLFDESHFKDEEFQPEKIWALLNMTLHYPNRYFICYDKKEDTGEITGFVFGYATKNYFSSWLTIQDYAMYVKPEYRGTSIFYKLLKVFSKWGRDIGANEMILALNTGIAPEASAKMLLKLGFKKKAELFSKEIE